jgi:hypothetical protein
VSAFCFGDGSQAVACPCGNTGTAGRGCQNSTGGGGAGLSANGSPGDDSVVLHAIGEPVVALSIVFQSTATTANPALFGDGLRCLAVNLKRLYVKSAAAGSFSAPGPGDPSIRTRSAQLGDPIPLGGIRNYQVYYRDPNAGFCPAPNGGTFNISNALRIVWI